MRNARALLLLEMCFGLPRLLAVPRTVPLSLEDAPAGARAREHYL